MEKKVQTEIVRLIIIILTFLIILLFIFLSIQLRYINDETGYSETPFPENNEADYSPFNSGEQLFNLQIEIYPYILLGAFFISALNFLLYSLENKFFKLKKKTVKYTLKKKFILSVSIFLLIVVFEIIFLNLI